MLIGCMYFVNMILYRVLIIVKWINIVHDIRNEMKYFINVSVSSFITKFVLEGVVGVFK